MYKNWLLGVVLVIKCLSRYVILSQIKIIFKSEHCNVCVLLMIWTEEYFGKQTRQKSSLSLNITSKTFEDTAALSVSVTVILNRFRQRSRIDMRLKSISPVRIKSIPQSHRAAHIRIVRRFPNVGHKARFTAPLLGWHWQFAGAALPANSPPLSRTEKPTVCPHSAAVIVQSRGRQRF